MSTNVNLLGKGLKYLGVLIFLFIAAPISLTMAFKALKKFEDTPNEYLSYLILAAAGILMVFTVFFAFKTIKILLNAIFNT
tara:strand:- start:803 stop:1045 length:243 start_codon:yes stop_codon:yes gene_type:complete